MIFREAQPAGTHLLIYVPPDSFTFISQHTKSGQVHETQLCPRKICEIELLSRPCRISRPDQLVMPSNLKSTKRNSLKPQMLPFHFFPRELPKDWIPDERASQTEQVFTGSCKPSCAATSRLIWNLETNGMSFKPLRRIPASLHVVILWGVFASSHGRGSQLQ